ncbi:hypothetical protein B0H11DRAFT_2352940 [Mycena galericulata]|nr:hypothetical protein B0H11DRAFT_2352940 [Mycena galericulata]
MAWAPRCSGFLFGRDSRFRQCRMNVTVVSEPPFEEMPFGGRPFLSIEAFSPVTLQIFVRGTANYRLRWKELMLKTTFALIQRQISKWPLPQGKLQKENKANLKAKLLDPSLGFTTVNPLTPGVISSPVPAVSQGILSDPIDEASRTGSSGAERTSVVNEEVKDIHLLVDDSRPTSEVVRTFQRVKVAMVDSKECEEGGWRVKSSDIISALQNSPGRLYGRGRIGVPAHFDGSYTEYFVQMNTDEPIGALAFDPELLVIPRNNRLNLRIGRGWQASSSVATATESVSGSSGSVARIKEPTTREIEWLKDRVKILPGYTNFEANRHKNLQNLDRVEYWRFAFNVDQQFYKTSLPAEISTRKITKPAIQQVLQIGTTALAESIQMIGIIDRYTAQGDNYSAEVAAEISKSVQEDPKATVLKAFLIQWEKDHPVAK